MVISLTTHADCRDALRRRELRQALYNEGDHLMAGVIVNLHGDAHVARRRLENRLFRLDTFAWYEAHRIPTIIDRFLKPAIEVGEADLRSLARKTMMTLSVEVAGVDLDVTDASTFDHFYSLMGRLAQASTVAHATGEKLAIVADGDDALAEFAGRYFAPSVARRRTIIATEAASAWPRDVLTTLLVNDDRLDLDDATMLREVAYFPWVGSHSTSNQFVHAMHHLFDWIEERPDDRPRLIGDDQWRQRLVHESLRLHPASPVALRECVAAFTLRSGQPVALGERVAIDIRSANRDETAVGPRPACFDPHRQMADDVAPWGLSFGHGSHSCLGRELAGGTEPDTGAALIGAIAVMAGAVLAAGGSRAGTQERDSSTSRDLWGRYGVRFGPTVAT